MGGRCVVERGRGISLPEDGCTVKACFFCPCEGFGLRLPGLSLILDSLSLCLLLQDLSLSTSQLHLMGGGLLSLLCPGRLPGPPGTLVLAMLGRVAQQAVLSGCCSVASVAPHQQLAWLLEAEQAEQQQELQGQQGANGATGRKWRQLLRQSLVHEAWLGFHRGLWAGPTGLLPAAHAGHICEYQGL